MITALVSYTIKPEFIEENRANIRKFMKDFQQLDPDTFVYNVFVKEDGVSFVHMSSYKDQIIQQQILNTPSFLEFQQKRDASGLEGSHGVSLLDFVDSSQKIL